MKTLCDTLARLPTVRHLNLKATQVSDKSIACLQQLRELRVLDLRKSAFTEEGVRTLGRRLPECRILFGPTATSTVPNRADRGSNVAPK